MAKSVVSVLVEGGPPKPLDYTIPADLGELRPGMRVQVPLRGQLKEGVVHALRSSSTYTKLQSVLRIHPSTTAVPDDLWMLSAWMARYYATPLNTVLRAVSSPAIRKSKPKTQLEVRAAKTREALRCICIELRSSAPSQARALETIAAHKGSMLLTDVLEKADVARGTVNALAQKKLITLEHVVIDRSPLKDYEYFPTQPKTLNDEQQIALDAILSTDGFGTHLIHGVTGSGKTEIYLQAISHMLEKKKGVIVLVPEIALTTQIVERFRSRLQDQIAVLHYRLSDGERLDEWRRIQSGQAPVAIGARSAIFSPMPNLGLIIVDEEHEHTYKQSDSAPRYHARNVAVMRGKICNCPVVLGSATPSLESFHNARTGKYILSTLKGRADTAQLPSVRIIDMKEAYAKAKAYTLFCDELLDGLKERYAHGEQAILFLNRRGYFAMQWCTSCQQATQCEQCDVALTFHRISNALTCHLCGYKRTPPRTCVRCGQCDPISFRGAGTEQVERALCAILPDLRVLRIDADTTKHKGSLERLLRHFRTGRADVVIGTQMIAKGLHFPQVTLVGVLNSDSSLNLPDFRASETVFQLVTQVAGRAGRGERPGEVIVQTSMPDHPVLKLAARQDYESFYEREVIGRAHFGFPPYSHLVKLTFDAQDANVAREAAECLHAALQLKAPHTALPVAESGYTRIKGRYRFQSLLKGPSVYHINEAVSAALAQITIPRTVRLIIDVDPTSTFF